mgnify:CR=1 FL=1
MALQRLREAAENAKIRENDSVYDMAYRENFVLELLLEVMGKNQA